LLKRVQQLDVELVHARFPHAKRSMRSNIA
jgi:hypothetical protein